MRYLKETYKTYEGARKRVAFERAMNPGEYTRGDVAHRYVYGIEMQTDNATWRITKARANEGN